jgi:hypothetical protein
MSRFSGRATERGAARSTPVAVGLALACLWALNAAAVYVPGTGYLRFPVVFAIAAGILLWRTGARDALRPKGAHLSGVTVGLACWAAAATLSTILNAQTEQVVLTYVSVFVAGAAVYASLFRIRLARAHIDLAVAGLALGALFPLVGGLVAFAREWGIPDIQTAITAWQNTARMDGYQEATFGNRGNTAGFLLIVTPVLLAILLDRRRHAALRGLCAVTLVPVALNLVLLLVRAAYLTLLASLVLVWIFKLGTRRLPVLAGALAVACVLVLRYQPDTAFILAERVLPAVTVDTVADASVEGRVAAIAEGWRIARRNWLLGVGPGGAPSVHFLDSAHQFQVQQAMETGILGLLGVTMLCVGVWVSLVRTIARGRHEEVNDTRFTLLIGPAAFLTYAMLANAALNNGSVNTWTVLVASMLALTPQFERSARRFRVRAAAAHRSVRRSCAAPVGGSLAPADSY